MPDRLALTRRFQSRVDRIGARAAALTATAWAQLDTHDREDIATFVAATAPTLTATKAASVATAVAYYSVLTETRAPAISPLDVLVPNETREPFIAFWRALKTGNSLEDALASGRARSAAIARNLAVSSSRRTGDVFFDRSDLKPIGWERVLDAGACPWCELVAGQLYKSAESADFGHDRCGCSAVPVLNP